MKGFLYILQTVNNSYYIGSTNNLSRRIREHYLGQEKYTRNRLPVTLVFTQEFETLHKARLAERWMKKQKSRALIHQILSDGKIRRKL